MNLFKYLFSWFAFLGVFGLNFSSSKSATSSASSDDDTDNRNAVQDGVALSGSSGNAVTYNSTDAVKAISLLGTEAIQRTGAAVVDLNKDSMQANAAAWDRTVTVGAGLVDKLIDASTSLGSAAITNYQPAENKAQDTSLKLGMIAAAGVAAMILLRKA